MEKLVHFIRRILPMAPEEARAVALLFHEKTVSQDEFLLKEGDVCNRFCFVDEGFFRVFTYDLDGNEVTTGFFGESQIVCEQLSFFQRTPAREMIQAVETSRVVYVSFEEIQTLFQTFPRMQEFGRLMMVHAYTQLKMRLLSSLHHTAEERYHTLLQTDPDLFQHVPLKQIASYLGITDTSLSRIRREITQKKK